MLTAGDSPPRPHGGVNRRRPSLRRPRRGALPARVVPSSVSVVVTELECPHPAPRKRVRRAPAWTGQGLRAPINDITGTGMPRKTRATKGTCRSGRRARRTATGGAPGASVRRARRGTPDVGRTGYRPGWTVNEIPFPPGLSWSSDRPRAARIDLTSCQHGVLSTVRPLHPLAGVELHPESSWSRRPGASFSCARRAAPGSTRAPNRTAAMASSQPRTRSPRTILPGPSPRSADQQTSTHRNATQRSAQTADVMSAAEAGDHARRRRPYFLRRERMPALTQRGTKGAEHVRWRLERLRVRPSSPRRPSPSSRDTLHRTPRPSLRRRP